MAGTLLTKNHQLLQKTVDGFIKIDNRALFPKTMPLTFEHFIKMRHLICTEDRGDRFGLFGQDRLIFTAVENRDGIPNFIGMENR